MNHTIDINYLQDLARRDTGYYQRSYNELAEAREFYLGNHYTAAQHAEAAESGLLLQKHNMYREVTTRLVGYMSTIVNTVRITGQNPEDSTAASVLHDTVNFVFRQNHFDEKIGPEVLTEAILSGVYALYAAPVDTGSKDQFGRPLYEIEMEYVPVHELILDPDSRKTDYSDATRITRRQLLTKKRLEDLFPDKVAEINGISATTYSSVYNDLREYRENYGYAHHMEEYELIELHHTIIRDGEKTWSFYWAGNVILEETEITYKKTRFPYVIHKIEQSPYVEFFGLLRDFKENQQALNRRLILKQRALDQQKVLVTPQATKDVHKLAKQVSSPGPVIEVQNLKDIEFIPNSADISHHSEAFVETIGQMRDSMGLNASFYGQAYASDSGRKVEIQQRSANVALRKFEKATQEFYRGVGRHIASLIQQYWKATQIISLIDERAGQKFFKLNEPEVRRTVSIDENTGEEVEEFSYIAMEARHPETGDPLKDEKGEQIWVPKPLSGTEIHFFDTDIVVDSTTYDDKHEMNEQMINGILNGVAGQLLLQIDPAEYFHLVRLSLEGYKTEQSQEIKEVLKRVTDKLAQQSAQPGGPQ